MTIDEFFAAIDARGLRFRLVKGQVRRFGYCPICTLANAIRFEQTPSLNGFKNHRWRDAARALGLPLGPARRLVLAADANWARSRKPRGFRLRLLERTYGAGGRLRRQASGARTT